MTRMTMLSHPMLLGFEEMERLLERVGKSGADGYPPYNIERIRGNDTRPDRLRITLAVAGFKRDELEVTVEDRQLMIRGRQVEDTERDYLHRGIAARQFQKSFVIADGLEIDSADLASGLLSIDLIRVEPERTVRRVPIGNTGSET